MSRLDKETTRRVDRWEKRAEVPLLLLSAVFLIAYIWPSVDGRMGPGLQSSLRVVTWAVWILFVLDFAVRICLVGHRNRRDYVISHWYDVAMIAIPVLRGLRVLRLADHLWAGLAGGRTAVYAGGTSVTLIVLGALAVLNAESSSPEANITTYGNALWWAVVTTTTVGYGDYYPVTAEGRLVAVGLMVVGIGFIGASTGVFAAALMRRVGRTGEPDTEN
jgi:voltage-gated potassium channel